MADEEEAVVGQNLVSHPRYVIEELNRKLKLKNLEITELQKQTKNLETEKNDLEKRLEVLEELSLHLSLKVSLLKNAELKELKEQISALKTEKKELEKRIKSLESEVSALKSDKKKESEKRTKSLKSKISELGESHGRMEGRNMALEEEIGNLKETIQSMKKNFQEDARLRKKLEDYFCATQPNSDEAREKEDNLLLGELRWRIQSLIYKKILPPTVYHEKQSYKVDFIERDINLLEDEDKGKARQAWDGIPSPGHHATDCVRR